MIRMTANIIDGEVVFDGFKVAELNYDMEQFLIDIFSDQVDTTVPTPTPTPTEDQGQIDSEKK